MPPAKSPWRPPASTGTRSSTASTTTRSKCLRQRSAPTHLHRCALGTVSSCILFEEALAGKANKSRASAFGTFPGLRGIHPYAQLGAQESRNAGFYFCFGRERIFKLFQVHQPGPSHSQSSLCQGSGDPGTGELETSDPFLSISSFSSVCMALGFVPTSKDRVVSVPWAHFFSWA